MIAKLDRLMLISGIPEVQTFSIPGFMMCSPFLLPHSGQWDWQERIYQWAYAQAQAQVAAERAAMQRAIFDPAWN